MERENNQSTIIQNLEKLAPYFLVLRQNWRKLLYINTLVAILSIIILFLFVKNYYDSTVVILPDYGVGGHVLGGLSSLAAMAGVNIGETPPVKIYENLLQSEEVIKPVVYKKYNTKKFDHPVDLIEYYEIELKKTDEKDPIYLQERDKFLQMLKIFRENILKTDVDRLTNILTVTVRTNEPILSAEVANSLVASLDQYVRTKRKSNAKEQRIYIEKRTEQVKDSLRLAEDKLKEFREKNRIVNLSPQLLLEQSRLMRDVEVLQTVYIELTKQMELIKLEEVKDAPIINIREEAGIPIIKAGPKRSVYFILIMLFSFIISVIAILFGDTILNYFKLLVKYL